MSNDISVVYDNKIKEICQLKFLDFRGFIAWD